MKRKHSELANEDSKPRKPIPALPTRWSRFALKALNVSNVVPIPSLCDIIVAYATSFQGEITRRLKKQNKKVMKIVSLNNNKLATIFFYSPDVLISSLETGKHIHTLKHPTDVRNTLVLTSGKLLCMEWLSISHVWDIDNILATTTVKVTTATTAASTNGLSLTSSTSTRLGCEFAFRGVATPVSGGKLAIGARNNSLQLWNVESNVCEQTFVGHRHNIRAIIQTQEDRLVSTSENGQIMVWSISKPECPIASFATAVAFSLNLVNFQSGLFGTFDVNELSVWDSRSGAYMRTIKSKSVLLEAIVLPSGDLVTSEQFGLIRVWDLKTGKCLRTMSNGRTNRCLRMVALGNDCVAVVSDYKLRVWNTQKGSTVVNERGNFVLGPALQDERLVCALGAKIWIWS